jgi:ribosome-binding ATPase YchF (GTP1/OBG family)
LREADLGQEELRMVRTYQLLSIKPMLIALNCDETQHGITQGLVRKVSEEKGRKNTKALAFFGRIDMEIAELGDEEAMAFMAEYGIRESALDTLIREAYALLGLQSFFTVGEDECRAWTIRRGMTAQEAAGVIHSDFYDKFIRAEVVHFDDFVAHGGSFPRVKEAGLWRLEGKEYRVKDGDIISIRHG